MSIFNDKTYEKMDWLSQAVEPYVCPLNDILAKLPEKYTLSSTEILQWIAGSSYRRINASAIVDIIFASSESMQIMRREISWEDKDILANCFKMEHTPIALNATSGAVNGEISLVKVINILDDNVIKKVIKRHIGSNYLNAKDCSKEAIDEIGALLFENKSHNFFLAKTPRLKLDIIGEYINESVDKDTFKIRSLNAYKRFVSYVEGYLKTQDEESLGIIYKVLMMAKMGQVIYTVGE